MTSHRGHSEGGSEEKVEQSVGGKRKKDRHRRGRTRKDWCPVGFKALDQQNGLRGGRNWIGQDLGNQRREDNGKESSTRKYLDLTLEKDAGGDSKRLTGVKRKEYRKAIQVKNFRHSEKKARPEPDSTREKRWGEQRKRGVSSLAKKRVPHKRERHLLAAGERK